LGLSAERLAEALGVTAARVEEWEIGARRVGGEHLRMISEILGAGPDAFFEIASSDSILPISFAQRLASPGPTVEECVRLVRAFRVITDTEAREAILALVVALSPDPMSQN
jgi:transcriptional regulator with XRE-family HTH domain